MIDGIIQEHLVGSAYVINVVKDKVTGCMKWHPIHVLIESFRLKFFKTSVTLLGIINPGCAAFYNSTNYVMTVAHAATKLKVLKQNCGLLVKITSTKDGVTFFI